MNIKSLLLGSAAALVAVSGARAADAVVVAEPEPMEFVRICDTYGTGFYYIPGTETCLKIGGYVRYEIQYAEDDDGWRKLARAELEFDARSETELGTLTRYIELRGDVLSGRLGPSVIGVDGPDADTDLDSVSFRNGGNVQVQYATITLGGLSLGLYDTLYDGDINGEFDQGGGDRVHYINYTFDAGNGISITGALEEANYNRDYTPNVVGRVSVVQGWGAARAFAAYDATAEEFALKGVVVFNATDMITLNAIATYESGSSFYSVDPGPALGYEFSLGGSVKFQANEKIALIVGAQYFGENHVLGGDDWAVGAVVDYNIVKDFDAKLALNYNDGDNYVDGVFSGFLRLEAGF